MNGPGRSTAVAIALVYLGAGMLPCGGASAAAIALATARSGRNAASEASQPEAHGLPHSAAATRPSDHGTHRDHRNRAGAGAQAGHAGHAGHAATPDANEHAHAADRSLATGHAEHVDPPSGRPSGHDAHAEHHSEHSTHSGHAAHTGNTDEPAAAPTAARELQAPCDCGCSGPSDAPSGNTARIGFGLLAAAWDRAAAAAPPHPIAILSALPRGPHSELDPVPI